MEVKDLKPQAVFEIFDQITKIPRPSKKEEKIRQFILDFAKAHGIEAMADKAGNVILRKPASKGHENAPTTILQGHMDMAITPDSISNTTRSRLSWKVNGCAPKAPPSAPTTVSAWQARWP